MRALIAEQKDAALDPLLSHYTREKAAKLRGAAIDPEELGRKGLSYEKLDQLMMEHLLGVRG